MRLTLTLILYNPNPWGGHNWGDQNGVGHNWGGYTRTVITGTVISGAAIGLQFDTEKESSLIYSTSTGTLNQLYFIIVFMFHLISNDFIFQFLDLLLMEYACLLACIKLHAVSFEERFPKISSER